MTALLNSLLLTQKTITFRSKKGLLFQPNGILTGLLDERSAELESVESIEISKADLKQLPISTIPNTPLIKGYECSL